MSRSICWLHVGDLHMEERNGWQSRTLLERIVAEANEHLGDQLSFVFLPGDVANNGRPDEYAQVRYALASLKLPVRVIPGDHDFARRPEGGFGLAAYEAAFTEEERAELAVIAGHRCIFLDIVSAGHGGPDFRLTMHQRFRLANELARAEAEGQVPLVFMHAYPGDLAADGEEVARTLAAARTAFVDTGHTHYNELLNDGAVIYGATRSTGEIEEGGGAPGYALVCVHDGVPSWRFKPLDGPWPFVQILSPCDIRLVTRPTDPRQVPRPGVVPVVARVFGQTQEPVTLLTEGGTERPMQRDDDGLWHGEVDLDFPGLHRVSIRCGEARDRIDILVRPADALPKRALPVAPGQACHAIGHWAQAGIEGTQLGPNRNGRGWGPS